MLSRETTQNRIMLVGSPDTNESIQRESLRPPIYKEEKKQINNPLNFK